MGINEDLVDNLITHQHYVQRFNQYEVRRIRSIFAAGEREIKAQLVKVDITKWSRARFETQLNAITEIQQVYNKQYKETIVSDLKQFGEVEGKWGYNSLKPLEPVLSVAKINLAMPSTSKIWALAKADPLMVGDGILEDLIPYLDRLSATKTRVVSNALRQGYLLDKTSAQIARELTQVGGQVFKSRQWADTVVNTSMNHMNATARKAVAYENPRIVKGYEWLSTLDVKTTDICIYRDGRIWLFNARARENTESELLDGEIYPPGHIGCRSTFTYVTRSWQEMGVRSKDISAPFRASMDGAVPNNPTYMQWLEGQSGVRQKDVLGATRYKMWKNGEVSIEGFWGKDGRMMTLKQLSEVL